MNYRVGIGQDSHRFLENKGNKMCIIGGVSFEGVPGMDADSDGDVALHAICNSISSISGIPILGGIAIDLCKNNNITDSSVYLQEALKTLTNFKIAHVALTIEGQRPRMQSRLDEVRQNIANLLDVDITRVGITVTSGDGLTSFGRGEGLMCFCSLTVYQ